MNANRRSLLKGLGTVGASLTIPGLASASDGGGESGRFLIDLQEVSRDAIPDDVEIIHDISEIDLLAARGDPSVVPGASSTVPDVSVQLDGPVKEHTPNSPDGKGPAWDTGEVTNTELQWDKRDQRVGDLTDRPDSQQVVHDTTKGEGTRIAVVDSGVYGDHPDLADVINPELSENFTTDPFDWRPNGASDHGTHVAGTIAATNASGNGVLGTAPETEIVSMRVFSGQAGASGDVIAALIAAANRGCDAANISLGFPAPYVDPEEYPFLLAVKVAYERAAAYARSQDMSIINSAGNDGLDMDAENILSLPTEAEGIFGVSATGPIGFLWDDKQPGREDVALKKLEDEVASPAFYTNYGSAVDVSASGGDADLEAIRNGAEGWFYDLVLSTVVRSDGDGNPVPGYGWKAGTSMAAPQVAGAYALVRSLRPDASAAEVEALIRDTARSAPGDAAYHGAGHLDLRRLVRAAE